MNIFGAKFNVGTGLLIGAGAVLLAPIVVPVAAAVIKPLLKTAIKGGMLAYEGTKVSIAEAKESIEDLAAEAKSEIAQRHAGK